ncbi:MULTISPECIES: carboxymuconolactone decarboxylase family protein [unclassified Herbaspirillum]|uniref:carboxymuconolactone decarboxylase family protein n=1 Tax=unclassified Herbaspirillum TaxID=2624150 RepID=UPI0011527C13|nr:MULTISPECIES: carboxymuconolactone decarboxylase family protein [unclassified Herbaspirillum]MBB5390845.1 AhpD family alkylhydroperoxidase [Herbaspirillum sp. SJZ102]TQK06371.1 AhpD family alkylhydroperoxidase [Herbaspirillum sp. SJZ130]TQK12151.1 AhpD family alkylhydroperoxidase [Herbaspirillum sp. SJZ106]TWC64522.1 AhpD family alkylhydroperoxidase [Herbaspirillum sp. SJZ099]
MSKRIDMYKNATEPYNHLLAANNYLKDCSLPAELVELVFLRVSLINGCAYCIDKHSRDLLKSGMTVDKLVLVPVWHEAGTLFSPREQAALAWAEVVTRIGETAAPDADYQAAAAHFNEKEFSELTIAIALMNALNRMAISGRMAPQAAKA